MAYAMKYSLSIGNPPGKTHPGEFYDPHFRSHP